MMNKISDPPNIPDYEILRKIGKGAYGEVWLAKSITDALRAIKIVSRSDFDDEKNFEREFEGVQKFEPLSRDHAGLIHLLHVGRGQYQESGDSFYYYVMELGDDIVNGRNFIPAEYEARTLRSDMLLSDKKPQAVIHCVDVGIVLADALQYLHTQGLSHRDIKPANIIFVNGKPKLADIGLVAATGQRTFVGTEGFVPPEGPGSSNADVYSLGKVLYEMVTGLDRLQFPELPELFHPDTNTKQWQDFNYILCSTCDPNFKNRNIFTGEELSTNLQLLLKGKKLKKNSKSIRIVTFMLAALLLIVGISYLRQKQFLLEEKDPIVQVPQSNNNLSKQANTTGVDESSNSKQPKKIINKSLVVFNVSPSDGVEVISESGEFLGVFEQLELESQYEIGEKINFTLRKENYEDYEVDFIVPDSISRIHHEIIVLKKDRIPVNGKIWFDSLSQIYRAMGDSHVTSLMDIATWKRYAEQNIELEAMEPVVVPFKSHHSQPARNIIFISEQQADKLAEFLTDQAKKEGRLNDNFTIKAVRAKVKDLEYHISKHKGLLPLRMQVINLPTANLNIKVSPIDAEIYIDGKFKGFANETNFKVKSGIRTLEIKREGYTSYTKMVFFEIGKISEYEPIRLIKNDSLNSTTLWENKLGMRFIPINENLMSGVWETRIRDYKEYCNAKGLVMPRSSYNQILVKPIVGITFNEAKEFVEWLNETDRSAKLLPEYAYYAIPTDEEWSAIVGLKEDRTLAIEEKSQESFNVYPWEKQWSIEGENKLVPLKTDLLPLGNFSDETRRKHLDLDNNYFEGYTDGHNELSPVGCYPANKFGVCDLAGNVSEMVANTVDNGRLQVLRGSNFKSSTTKQLRSSYRSYIPVGTVNENTGFRIVIRLESSKN